MLLRVVWNVQSRKSWQKSRIKEFNYLLVCRLKHDITLVCTLVFNHPPHQPTTHYPTTPCLMRTVWGAKTVAWSLASLLPEILPNKRMGAVWITFCLWNIHGKVIVITKIWNVKCIWCTPVVPVIQAQYTSHNWSSLVFKIFRQHAASIYEN